jgi:hypothetical protein
VDVKEPLGTNPPLRYRPPPQKKQTKEILLRHRKWLQQVQEKKAEQAQQIVQETVQHLDKVKKLTEVTSKQRKFLLTHPPEDKIKQAFNATSPLRKLIENFDKPKWALTEEEQEKREEEEVDDLLKYAMDLDFDKYIEDLEVQSALEILKDRIATLVESKKTAQSDKPGPDLEQGKYPVPPVHTEPQQKQEESVLKPQPLIDGTWDKSTRLVPTTKVTTKVARALAEKILKANPQLRSVHSNQSIRQIVEGGA